MTYTKVTNLTGPAKEKESNPIYVDYMKEFNGTDKAYGGKFVWDDHFTSNILRGKGAPVPPDTNKGHFHVGWTEFWFIMEGHIGMKVEGEKYFVCDPGDVMIAAQGRWHRAGDDPERAVVHPRAVQSAPADPAQLRSDRATNRGLSEKINGGALRRRRFSLCYRWRMDEFGIIAKYFAPLAGEGAFGLKDDAALLPARPGQDLVITTDTITEGVDFFAFDPSADIARKALRVNLSDLAAKGAVPAHYLLNLSLPHTITPDWLAGFADGLAQDQQEFGISLLGGDTGATDGPLTIAVTAFGFVPQGKMVRRNGARIGDAVYVTGTIGDSGGGLAIFKREKHSLSDADRDALIARYRVPQPPVAFAAKLRAIAHASVDVSDGLIADLGHIASASGVHIVVEGERCPYLCRCVHSGATPRFCAPSRRATITRSLSPRRRDSKGRSRISAMSRRVRASVYNGGQGGRRSQAGLPPFLTALSIRAARYSNCSNRAAGAVT